MTSLPHSAFYRRGRCKKRVRTSCHSSSWHICTRTVCQRRCSRLKQKPIYANTVYFTFLILNHYNVGSSSLRILHLYFPGYELFGFISHMGASTMSGHYVCHIKKEGRWVPHNQPLMWWRLENTQSLPLVHIQSLNQVSRTFLLKRRRLLLLLLLFTSWFTRSLIISILKIQLLWMFFIFFSQWLNWNLIY